MEPTPTASSWINSGFEGSGAAADGIFKVTTDYHHSIQYKSLHNHLPGIRAKEKPDLPNDLPNVFIFCTNLLRSNSTCTFTWSQMLSNCNGVATMHCPRCSGSKKLIKIIKATC